MKLKALVAGITLAALTQGALAADLTRGFVVEQGAVAAAGVSSFDLNTQEDYINGSVRVGFGDAEVIVNGGTIGYSELVVKAAVESVAGLAVYGGVYMFDQQYSDDDSYQSINFGVGAAYTQDIEQLTVTIAPKLVYQRYKDDWGSGSASDSELFLQVGLAAHLNLAKTRYGSFKPGVEVVLSTQDGIDPLVLAGVRWSPNDRLNIDAIPLLLGWSDDATDSYIGAPGMLRVNIAF